MSDNDMLRRGDVLKAVDMWESDWPCTYSAILALPAVQPDAAAVWNAAIREAAAAAWAVEGGDRWTREAAQSAILALIDKPAHVNETPKSEHVPGDVLTPAVERDRGFVMVMERAEKAEAEVARLTALLPHPGETAAEVMWRNHQRGVRLEELAKTAGVTRERARQMVRKAEMRMGGA